MCHHSYRPTTNGSVTEKHLYLRTTQRDFELLFFSVPVQAGRSNPQRPFYKEYHSSITIVQQIPNITMNDHDVVPAQDGHYVYSPTATYQQLPNTASSKSVSFDDATNSYIQMDKKHSIDIKYVIEEKDDRLDSRSVASSIMTADGIADPKSFTINCLAIFVGDMARGIFFPTMWNLVQTLDGDQVLLGYVNASFNFGRMLVLPLFGFLSTTRGYRWTLLLSTIILSFGTLMFAQVLTIGEPLFLMSSNVILGIGSGTLAVTRAYTSSITPTRKRTGYMALVSAIQYAGTTVTPLFGSLFVVIFAKRNGEEQRGFPELNEFTAPAVFMTMASYITLYLLYYHFEDEPSNVGNQAAKTFISERQKAYNELSNSPACFGLMTIYTACLIGCMFLNAFLKGPMSCFETLGIEFAESHFNLQREEAGSIVAACGFLGALTLIVMRIFITEFYNDTQIIIVGYTMFITGIIINTQLDREYPENNPTYIYALSMFFTHSIGYPVCHVGLIGLFSKVIGRKPQGTLLGLFSASGSISRVFFPVLSGYIVKNRDIETLFYILATVLSTSLCAIFAFRHILIELSS